MNMFQFVGCSKNDVRVLSMFDKMVFDPLLLLIQVKEVKKLETSLVSKYYKKIDFQSSNIEHSRHSRPKNQRVIHSTFVPLQQKCLYLQRIGKVCAQ